MYITKIVTLNEMIILFILLKKMIMNDLAYFSTFG